jgi:hypothetical protein
MGLFKRGTRFDTGHTGDDDLLSRISKYSDLDEPRHWVHYLYCQDESAAREAAGEIRAGGWDIQSTEPAAQGPGWVVIAEKHDVVTSATAVRAARAFFESVASRVSGGDYDGWEVSV